MTTSGGAESGQPGTTPGTMSGCLEAEPGSDVNFQDVSKAPVMARALSNVPGLHYNQKAAGGDTQCWSEAQAWGRTLHQPTASFIPANSRKMAEE